MNILLLAIGGWVLAMVLVLVLLTMSGRQDRAARFEQAEISLRLRNRS